MGFLDNDSVIVDAILTEMGLGEFTHEQIQDPEWTLPQNENGEFVVEKARDDSSIILNKPISPVRST